MKDIYAAGYFKADFYAAGFYRGLGVGTSLQPVCLDYQCTSARPFYKATKAKPHFKAESTRPMYAVKGQEKWS